MKLITKHNDYIPYIYLPISAIAFGLLWFFPQQIILTFSAHWLILILAVLIAISPLGNIRLGNKNPNPLKWWLKIFRLQLALFFLYWGICYLVLQRLPVTTPADSAAILAHTVKTLLWQWGFFPWPLFMVIGIALAYFSYYQPDRGLLSNCLKPLFKNNNEESATIFTDYLVRLMIFFSIASALGFAAIQTLSVIASVLALPIAVNLQLNTLIMLSILIWLLNSKPWNDSIRILATKNISPAIIMILCIVTLAILVAILNGFYTAFFSQNLQLSANIVPLNTENWFNHWLIFSGMWWLSWTPLAAGLIAYLSQGWKIRSVIAAGLVLTFIQYLLLSSLLKTNIIYNLNLAVINNSVLWLGLILLLTLVIRKKYLIYLMRGILPETEPQKPRPWHFYLRALSQITGFVLIIYLSAGIIAINYFSFLIIFPFAIVTAITCIGFIAGIIRK